MLFLLIAILCGEVGTFEYSL